MKMGCFDPFFDQNCTGPSLDCLWIFASTNTFNATSRQKKSDLMDRNRSQVRNCRSVRLWSRLSPGFSRQGVWDYLVYDTGFPRPMKRAEPAGNPGSNPHNRSRKRGATSRTRPQLEQKKEKFTQRNRETALEREVCGEKQN